MRGARSRASATLACILYLIAALSRTDASADDMDAKTVRAFALAGVANSTLLPLPKYASTMRFAALELRLMGSGKHFVLGVFPQTTSAYCATQGVKEVWRRFARSLEGVHDGEVVEVVESDIEGNDVTRIAEAMAKASKARARKFGCGFIAHVHYNAMNVYEGAATDSSELASFFAKHLEHTMGAIEEVNNRHEAMEFIERNQTAVRVILLEKPKWADLYAKAMFGNAAYARASSLIGLRYLLGMTYNQPGIAGIMFIPVLSALNEADKLKRVDVKFIVREPEIELDYFAASEVVLDTSRALGYEALVESPIDYECANSVWQLASNSIHTEYSDEATEKEAEMLPPPRAWDFLKGDLLALLDGHGKGDKVLLPKQWLCGLAGLTAAHREMANEYAEVASAVSVLKMLQKENLGLRQRNAELERELARCDSNGGSKAPSGAKRLPKSKPIDWGFDSPNQKARKPQPPKMEEDVEEDVEGLQTFNDDDDKQGVPSAPTKEHDEL